GRLPRAAAGRHDQPRPDDGGAARAPRRRERLRAALAGRALPAGPASPPRRRQPPLLPRPDRGGTAVRAVVLGATGFIGRALVPALAEQHDVVAVSRSGNAPPRGRARGVAA